jgi:superfamily II DNA or RNA helicase
MEIIESFATAEEVIKNYSKKRPTVNEEDTKDLLRVMVKYLREKLKSNDFYALNTTIGTFYKDFNADIFITGKTSKTKEEKIQEKLFLNTIFKLKVPKEYDYEEFELLKENTNNSPIKN